jgi:PAS domain S-box-containing protein
MEKRSKKELLDEIEDLQIRLREAEETLSAIRDGEVDAMIVAGPEGEGIYTLTGAEQPYRVFVEKMNEGALTLTADATIFYCNKRFSEMLRMPLEKIVGSSLCRLVVKDDLDACMGILEHGKNHGGKGEVRLKTSDGGMLPIRLSVSPMHVGTVIAACAVVTDISERKSAEEKIGTYMSKLEISNKELQDFAFIASHDLQEPLRKLQVFGDLLVEKHRESLDSQAFDYIVRMQKAAARMSALLRSLLNYSRVATNAQAFTRVNLKEAVREALSNLEIRIRETHGSVTVGDLPSIQGDRSQMIQLFQNLIANAIKFQAQDKSPVVNIHSRPVENHRPKEKKYEIYVEDNGIGFDEKYLDRIFRPFERLHGRGEYGGVGMGLAICKKIVDRHHGTITAKSVPEEGTVFVLSFPAGSRKA